MPKSKIKPPELDEWEPISLAGSHDDWESKDEWEEYTPVEDDSFGSGYGIPSLRDIYSTALKIPGQLIETGVGAIDYAATPWRSMAPGTPTLSKVLKENTSYDPEGWEREISEKEDSERLTNARKELGQSRDFVESFNSYWRNPGLGLLDVEASAVPMYLGGAAGRGIKAVSGLGPLISGAIGEGGLTAAQQTADILREKDDFTPSDFLTTTGSAATTAGISGLGGRAANRLGLPDIDQMLADKTIKGSRRILPILGAMGNEAVEEGLQSAQEKAATNYATGKPIGEGVGQATVSGAIAGGLTSGGMSMYRGGVPKPLDTSKYEGTNETDETFDTETETLGTSFDVPAKEATDGFVKAMRDNGYVPVGQKPDGRVVFKRVDVANEPAADEPLVQDVQPPPVQDVQPDNDLSLQYNAPPPIDQTKVDAWDEKNPYTRPLNIPVEHLTPETRSDLETAGYVLVNQDATVSHWRHGTDPSAPAPTQEPAPTEDSHTGRRALYAAFKDNGNSDESAAAGVLKWQEKTNIEGRPMNVWRTASGGIGIVPADRPSPYKSGVKVATLYPEGQTAQEPFVPDDAQAHQEMWNNLPNPVGERTAEGQAAAGVGPDLVPTNDVDGLRTQTGLQRVGEQVQTGEILAADPTQYGPKGEGFLRRTLRANPNLSPGDIAQLHDFLVSLDAPSATNIEEDEWGPITPGHAESLLPQTPAQLPEAARPDGEILPAEAQQTEFERLMGLQPGQEMSDEEIERVKQFHVDQLRAMYGGDLVEGQAAVDEVTGTIGDEKLHYPELEDQTIVEKNITPAKSAKQTVIIGKNQLTPQILGNLNRSGYVEVGKTSDGSSRFEKEVVQGPSVSIVPPTANDVQKRVDAFDKQGQPDLAYKSITASSPRARLKKGQTWKGRAEAEIARLRAEEASTAPKQDPPENTDVELRHPTAIAWMARVKELDAAGAPDSAYRDIASTLAKKTLKKGDTWRAEIMGAIEYFESRVPPDSGVSSMARVAPFTPRSDDHRNYNKGKGKVQIYNLVEDIINQLKRGIPDDPRIGTILQQAEQLIENETDPEIIEDNLRQLEEYADRAHLPEGNSDQIELFGMLRDMALDKARQGGVSRMASTAERIKDIIMRMDEAQRKGDIREVTRLGSELQEIEDANRTRGADELYDRGLRGKEGRWWEGTGSLGPTVADMHDPSKSLAGEDTTDNFLTQMTGNTPDDFVRMEVGERTAILRNMQGSYAEHGARVANKELLQNAIDATPTGGTIDVDIDFKGGHITVTDQGLGLPIDLIKNEFVTLTGSGKRGQVSTTGRKTIGEMGVGKATYLLGTDSFEVTTVAKEPDGSLWEYTFRGDADTMIGETQDGTPVPPMKINKRQMPPGTPTGTTMRVYDADVKNLEAAREYLKTFAEYSDSPVTVNIKTNQHDPQLNQWAHNYYDINKSVTPRTATMGQHIASGSITGGDYSMHVPTNANWSDQAHSIAVIITARGMFQGVDQVHPGTFGVRVPDRIVLNIEPTVSAQDAKNYPLTSPTREKLKGPFKQSIQAEVKANLVDKIKDKAKADVKAAYDALVPGIDPNTGKTLPFVTNDRGGRYTVGEIYKFNGNPSVQGIARHIQGMMNDLNRLFSGPRQQLTKTVKFGWDLANLGAGGINIQDVANPAENAVLIGLFDALDQAGGDAKIAAELIAHTVLHEFNHNRARSEGADFTYKLRDTDARFGTDRRGVYAKAIEQLISDGRGGFNQGIRELIQQHTAARGRPDTKIDFIARQEQGGFLASPGSSYVPKNNSRSGEEATSSGVSNISYSGIQQATGWGQGPAASPPKRKKGQPAPPPQVNWVKEALAVPSGLTTTMDLSAPFRQGIGLVHTPQFWKAAAKMFGGLTEAGFNAIDADLRNKIVMRPRRNSATGKVMPSIAAEAGLKMFEPASTGGLNQRAQATASRWIEQGIGQGIGSKIWRNTAGVPIRASNRAYITFLNHLKVNRFEHLMDLSAKMHQDVRNTGQARPGLLKQNFTQAEGVLLNGYRNKVLAKELADFVNTATGQGPLKTHILPFKQTEVSLESASEALSHIFFSPGLIASRVRMLNPSTYVMATPQVRRQYMMSALATGVAWMSALALIKGGGGDEVEVNLENMTSADWMKAKIGDTRMDPGGGFQQFLVATARMIQGGTTSSASNDWREFGEGFNAPTQKSNIERFLSNKFNPVTKFAYDLASQSEYNPFHVKDRVAQLFVPLVIQDLIGLYYEDPKLLPWMAPILFGMGTQTYGRGESVGKLVDPENDWLATGGGVIDAATPEDF